MTTPSQDRRNAIGTNSWKFHAFDQLRNMRDRSSTVMEEEAMKPICYVSTWVCKRLIGRMGNLKFFSHQTHLSKTNFHLQLYQVRHNTAFFSLAKTLLNTKLCCSIIFFLYDEREGQLSSSIQYQIKNFLSTNLQNVESTKKTLWTSMTVYARRV